MLELFWIFLLCTSEILAADGPLSSSIAQFSTDLYLKTIETNNGNVIMSPYSVATALGLLSAGAKGRTYEQICTGLHVTGDKHSVADKFKASVTELKSKIGDSKLDVANKIYLQYGVQLKPEYKTIAIDKFHSDVEVTDFAESQQAADKINLWVEEKTNNKIKELIQPSMLDSDTRLVLVNAIYFKGSWEKSFKYGETMKKPFYISERQSVEMDFMNQEDHFSYGHFNDLECSALKMKYSHSDAALLVLLPDKRMGLFDLENKLHTVDLKIITRQMRERKIEVSFPKFKIEFESQMKDTLVKLGLTDMFSNADFTDISSNAGPLEVSKVIHKAFFEVNEEGAEAAASTGITMVAMSSMHTSEPEPKFIADHPFLFYILRGDDVLFIGRKNGW